MALDPVNASAGARGPRDSGSRSLASAARSRRKVGLLGLQGLDPERQLRTSSIALRLTGPSRSRASPDCETGLQRGELVGGRRLPDSASGRIRATGPERAGPPFLGRARSSRPSAGRRSRAPRPLGLGPIECRLRLPQRRFGERDPLRACRHAPRLDIRAPEPGPCWRERRRSLIEPGKVVGEILAPDCSSASRASPAPARSHQSASSCRASSARGPRRPPVAQADCSSPALGLASRAGGERPELPRKTARGRSRARPGGRPRR